MIARVGAIILLAVCGGCMTVQIYDGSRRDSDEVARISGDPRLSAGVPLSLILRQVDERTLGFGENSAEVLPGPHTLLVDCRIEETASVTRHSIEAEVFAGGRYKLVAEAGPGLRECTAVHLEAVN